MKEKINTYFAILIITVAGAGASLIIIHTANANVTALTFGSEAGQYASLGQ
ncbi:MAG TPA: hypothetical protein VMV50_01715 [Candidatus Paceibacterota bacterium]|nr:hypothetical protein [Candidatus Paceibacterota bacterium]